jgi:hypothetical protein
MSEDIAIGDYLTLLLHVSILPVTATYDSSSRSPIHVFKCYADGGAHHYDHLGPLLDVLSTSLDELLQYKNTQTV